MSVNVTDIQDYLTWRQNENAAGVRDAPGDYARYREQLEQQGRFEETIGYLVERINDGAHEVNVHLIYNFLTNVDYEPDDV